MNAYYMKMKNRIGVIVLVLWGVFILPGAVSAEDLYENLDLGNDVFSVSDPFMFDNLYDNPDELIEATDYYLGQDDEITLRAGIEGAVGSTCPVCTKGTVQSDGSCSNPDGMCPMSTPGSFLITEGDPIGNGTHILLLAGVLYIVLISYRTVQRRRVKVPT